MSLGPRPRDSGLPGLRCGLALWASGFPDESVVARTEARFPPRAPRFLGAAPSPPAPPRAQPSEAQRRCRATASPPGEPGSEMPHRLAAFPQTAARGQATPGDASRAWRRQPRTPSPGSSTRSQSQGRFRTRRVAPCCGSPRIASGRAADTPLTLQPGFHPLPALALKGGSGVGNTQKGKRLCLSPPWGHFAADRFRCPFKETTNNKGTGPRPLAPRELVAPAPREAAGARPPARRC